MIIEKEKKESVQLQSECDPGSLIRVMPAEFGFLPQKEDPKWTWVLNVVASMVLKKYTVYLLASRWIQTHLKMQFSYFISTYLTSINFQLTSPVKILMLIGK